MNNKHTGTNTSSMFYSERALKRKKKEAIKFYKNYNKNCGKCTTRIASKEEIEQICSKYANLT